jgi:hypothetical protein
MSAGDELDFRSSSKNQRVFDLNAEVPDSLKLPVAVGFRPRLLELRVRGLPVFTRSAIVERQEDDRSDRGHRHRDIAPRTLSLVELELPGAEFLVLHALSTRWSGTRKR